MPTQSDTVERAALPLLLNFREVLFGHGLVVEVKAVNGRALLVQEDGGSWIYGVNPGGMAAFGEDDSSARRQFRQTFSGVLKEIALECDTFSEFADAVQAFFHDTNQGYERDWREAVEVVRRDSISVEGLQKLSADAALDVSVSMKEAAEVQTTDNQPDLHLDLAA